MSFGKVIAEDVNFWCLQHSFDRSMPVQDPIFPELLEGRNPSHLEARLMHPYLRQSTPTPDGHAIVKHAILPLLFAFHLAPLFKEMRNHQLLQPTPQNSSLLFLPRPGYRCHIGTDIPPRFLWACPEWPSIRLPPFSLCRPQSSSRAMGFGAVVE